MRIIRGSGEDFIVAKREQFARRGVLSLLYALLAGCSAFGLLLGAFAAGLMEQVPLFFAFLILGAVAALVGVVSLVRGLILFGLALKRHYSSVGHPLEEEASKWHG